MRHHVYFGLGSNLGNRHMLLEQAIDALQQHVGSLVACSSFIETEPWGFESEHRFLNAVVHFTTEYSPLDTLLETQTIERQLGRTQKSCDGQYHDRPIDIDILMYDDIRLDETYNVDGRVVRLTLPHPHMHERDFVMKPLAEIDIHRSCLSLLNNILPGISS